MRLLFLPDGGTGFDSGVHGLAVCGGGSMHLCTPLKIKAKLYVYVFFWTEVLRKAVDSQKGCEQQTVKPLFLGVAKCTVV